MKEYPIKIYDEYRFEETYINVDENTYKKLKDCFGKKNISIVYSYLLKDYDILFFDDETFNDEELYRLKKREIKNKLAKQIIKDLELEDCIECFEEAKDCIKIDKVIDIDIKFKKDFNDKIESLDDIAKYEGKSFYVFYRYIPTNELYKDIRRYKCDSNDKMHSPEKIMKQINKMLNSVAEDIVLGQLLNEGKLQFRFHFDIGKWLLIDI